MANWRLVCNYSTPLNPWIICHWFDVGLGILMGVWDNKARKGFIAKLLLPPLSQGGISCMKLTNPLAETQPLLNLANIAYLFNKTEQSMAWAPIPSHLRSWQISWLQLFYFWRLHWWKLGALLLCSCPDPLQFLAREACLLTSLYSFFFGHLINW